MIAVDIETYDPNLKDLGSGCIRCDGYILCVGTYNGHSAKAYIPGDADWDELKERLASDEPKVFHNGIYDLGWLACSPMYNLKVNGIIHDTMTRAVFIDEYAKLDLDSCCKRMNVKGKNKEETIEAWFEEHKKDLGLKGSMWSNANSIWNDVVGRQKMIEYNLQDCRATYDLFNAQEPFMAPYADAYLTECELYPVLIHMKRAGIRIDMPKLEALRSEIISLKDSKTAYCIDKWGITPKILASPKQLREFMWNLGIHSDTFTDTGAESFGTKVLSMIDHPIGKDLTELKSLTKLLGTYLDGDMYRCIWNGRIHCDFSPNKRDEGGTITGRFSSSSPNLQNISAREYKHGVKTYGDEMRDLFIPNEGCWLFACDYSQIEYVLFMDYATGPQAEQVRQQIKDGVDFHTAVANMMGIKERSLAKAINYGKLYGMGYDSMLHGDNFPTWQSEGAKNNMTAEQYCRHVYDLYCKKMPVIWDTICDIQNHARMAGYVTSISGRRHHKPKPYYDKKAKRWIDGIYKMTNYQIQGSAADVLKKALVLIGKSGVLNTLQLHLTVHDENVCSVPKTKEGVEAAVELEKCMDLAFLDILKVPIRAEGGIGDSWASKHSEQAWQDLRVKYGFGSSADMRKALWKQTGHKGEIA